MVKFWAILFVAALFLNCGNKEKGESVLVEEYQAFSFLRFPSIVKVEPKVREVLEEWPEFKALEDGFSVLERASNKEDVKLAIDDLIAKEQALAKSDYPEVFDKNQIKSRQQVVRNFLYKVQGELQENRDIEKGMEQMLIAYNALRVQLNRMGGDTLDIKLILDGE